MKAKTQFTKSDMEKLFSELTKNNKISVLKEAIGYMQQLNSRTILQCIALAMGYENHDGEQKVFIKSRP